MISIRMMKICDTSVCRPLKLIFQSCLKKGKFPTEWKKANVVPVHKKGDKQILKNYRPILLLPIAGTAMQPKLFHGREGFVKLGHFDKYFMKKSKINK